MKLKLIAAAVMMAASASGFAYTTAEDSFIDGSSFVYTFGANRIAANETGFAFSLNSADNDFSTFFANAASYYVSGGISSTKFSISSVKLNNTTWVPTTGNDIDLGMLTVGPADEIWVSVTGNRNAVGATFSGQLVLTPVPEPETYAMMLAGLAALGFLARRRQG